MEYLMKATLKRMALCSRIVLVFCLIVGCLGCNLNEKKTHQQSTAQEKAAMVVIQPTAEEDAAAEEAMIKRAQEQLVPRTLMFEMVGTATPPKTGTEQEREAAAMQAAIIDSFCKALIEARHSRGQTTSDFTARLGPRLTITHCLVDDDAEIHAEVIDRGVNTTFVVRGGILQHTPHDWKAVQALFEETNGEFSLLDTTRSANGEQHFARVGCYLPQGFNTAIVGTESIDDTEEMP